VQCSRVWLQDASGLHRSTGRLASMDLLGYADTVVDVCLVGTPRRDLHDLFRQIYLHPAKIRVCPCVLKTADVWVWRVLQFLRPTYSNECTHPT